MLLRIGNAFSWCHFLGLIVTRELRWLMSLIQFRNSKNHQKSIFALAYWILSSYIAIHSTYVIQLRNTCSNNCEIYTKNNELFLITNISWPSRLKFRNPKTKLLTPYRNKELKMISPRFEIRKLQAVFHTPLEFLFIEWTIVWVLQGKFGRNLPSKVLRMNFTKDLSIVAGVRATREKRIRRRLKKDRRTRTWLAASTLQDAR